MPVLTVGPTSTYPSIAAALAVATAGDEISLESGYGGEDALVGVDNMSVMGDATSTGINLKLGAGIGAVTLLGEAPINVSDNSGANTITGNDGANVVTVSGGADVAHGGLGVDRLVVDYAAATASVIGSDVNITDGGTHSVTFDGFENFTVRTGSGADTITLGNGDNIFHSSGGNDTLTSGDGHNKINSGLGNDTVTAGNGANIIAGGAGNDTITTGSNHDVIRGGSGGDTISAGDGHNAVYGGGGNDTITTGSGADAIHTGAGNDTVHAGGGNDLIFVDGGVDGVDGEAGHDRLFVDYSHSTTNVTGAITSGSIQSGYAGTIADTAGTSSVAFSGMEYFTIKTGSGNDTVTTGDGHDTLIGGAGNDTLNGGKAADVLLGGDGNDILIGGLGLGDVLTGGKGADTYHYNTVAESTGHGHDIINGFDTTMDHFHLDVAVTGIDAKIMSGRLDVASFNGDLEKAITAATLAAHHAVMFTPDSGSDAGDLYIVVDANGVAGYQGGQDYVFEVHGGHHMAALSIGDFI